MSGQVVAKPVSPLAIVGIATAGIGLVGFASAVKSVVDKKVEAARKKMEAEKNHLKEWQAFQAEQRKSMQQLGCLQAAIGQAEGELSIIRLLQPREDRTGTGPTGQGYTSLGIPESASRKDIQSVLKKILIIMEGLPPEFKEDQASPYQRLEKHRARLVTSSQSKKPPILEELLSFKETVSRTLQSYLHSLEAMARKRQELSLSMDILLSDLLVCHELTTDPELLTGLDSIQSQIFSLAASRNVKPGHLELLQKRFAKTKQAIEYQNTNSAYRLSLAESLTRNLNEMGYETLEPFEGPEEHAMSQTTMSVPGGERVRIAIQADNRLSFEVAHESDSDKRSLDEEDLAFFRQQETKWCQDFQELIRRMTREGFSYQVKLERVVPGDSIPVVVVETADEIISEEKREEEAMDYYYDDDPTKRYLP
ncbi:MAG: hypothetical protein BBJ57_05160 [Desulfobacterales bacterium PC51MH44]|nr:MAG: hypothetical protein BBJ57_05160 [Desulfobacterales bacterium PC51MH44]